MSSWLDRSASTPLVLLAACTALHPQRECDLPFRTGSIKRARDGHIERAKLLEPATIDSLRCRGWVLWHPSGELRACDLAEPTQIRGHALPAGTRVWLDTDGRLSACFLACDTILDGLACRGGHGKIATSFHANGRLRSCFLTEDTLVQGVPCRASVFAPVYFDASGRLERCRLAHDWQHGGSRFVRGTELVLDEHGVPR